MFHVLSTFVLLATIVAGQEGEDVGLCQGDCAGKWMQCGGMNFNEGVLFDGFSDCCDEGFFCYSINKYYSQCRTPESTPPDSGWTGPFECTPCGPDSRELGEFVSDGCNFNFIGSYDLAGCAEACSSQGWIACDRSADAGVDEVVSCYGYDEQNPGDCGLPRNGNTNWISWLVCPSDGPIVAFAMSAAEEAEHAEAPIAPGEERPF